MANVLHSWTRQPPGTIVIAVILAFAVGLAGDDKISWPLAFLIVVAVIIVLPLALSPWIRRITQRWSIETALSALATAMLTYALTQYSPFAGILALSLALVAYLGGRYSKKGNGKGDQPGEQRVNLAGEKTA